MESWMDRDKEPIGIGRALGKDRDLEEAIRWLSKSEIWESQATEKWGKRVCKDKDGERDLNARTTRQW